MKHLFYALALLTLSTSTWAQTAEADFKTLLETDNDSIEAVLYNRIAKDYPKTKEGKYCAILQETNFTKALKQANTLVEEDSKWVHAYYIRGYMKSKLGDKQGALEDLNTSIRLNSLFSGLLC